MDRERPNPRANQSILYITYAAVALFACMAGYFGYFLQVRGETVINNSYNARLDRFSDRIIRGELRSADGQVLARTDVGEGGAETRVYPCDSLFAHVVGYSDHGKTGLEALANFYLLSSHINLVERTVNELSDHKNFGDHVITTLDTRLQQAASDALGDRKGAVIAMEPDTGKVLAMVSKPGFNPNTLAQDWESLISEDNTEAQLLNRATQGLYPPGSVFKIVMLLEYIREHPDSWRDYTFDCSGQFLYENYKISCYHGNVHGHLNIGEAFADSCNGAFASLGLGLDREGLRALAGQLLFNKELPLALAYNKSSFALGEQADAWQILQTSIGQGNTQVTPMHIAMITAAVANGGVLMKPYLIDHVESAAGGMVKEFLPSPYGNLMSAEEADVLSVAMRMVVTDGTGSALRDAPYEAAGKTGSAEFEAGRETHAWFTGYAPASSPRLVVTVIVEEAGSGGQVAAPVARAVFDTWYSLR